MFDKPKSLHEAAGILAEMVNGLERRHGWIGAQSIPIPVEFLVTMRDLYKQAASTPVALDAMVSDALRKAITEGRGADAEAFHRLMTATEEKPNG